MDQVHHFSPDPEDFAFNYSKIKKGYGVLAALSDPQLMKLPLSIYRKATHNDVVADSLMPENASNTFKAHLTELRHATRMWEGDLPDSYTTFQRDYSGLVKSAYDDLQRPLASVSEVETVLKRLSAPESDSERVVLGVSLASVEEGLKRTGRLKRVLENFADMLKPVVDHGNMVVGSESEAAQMQIKRELARPVTRKSNEFFEMELRVLGFSGILQAENDGILKGLDVLGQTDPQAAQFKADYNAMTRIMADYAKFKIERPQTFLDQLRPHIPGCVEGIRRVEQAAKEGERPMLEIIRVNLEEFAQTGRNRGTTDT